jgi:hypothetical protein
VRAGAEVDEVAVLVISDLLAFGNVLEIADLEFARVAWTLVQSAEPAALCVLDGLFPGDRNLFKDVIGFDLLFHLLLDLGKIFG